MNNLVRLIGPAPSELDSLSLKRLVRREQLRITEEIDLFQSKPTPKEKGKKTLEQAKAEYNDALAKLAKLIKATKERTEEIVGERSS